MAPSPSPPSLSSLLSTLLLALALPLAQAHEQHSQTLSLHPSTPSASAPSPSDAAPPQGAHLPLLRRNGHLAHLSRLDKREHKQDVVRSWALREAGRLKSKYGASEARLRRRSQERGAQDEAEQGEGESEDEGEREEDDLNEEEERRRRKRRSRREEHDAFPTSDPSLSRRQIGAGLPLSSSSSSSSTRTALSVAGYGDSTSTSSTSPSQVWATTATRTAAGSRATETLPVGMAHTLNYEADLSYYAPVGIGVPAQYMNCILDTGSADLWIASSLCLASAGGSGCSSTTPLYNASLSSTRLDMNTSFSVRYGSGSAQGDIFQDYVAFAGYNVSSQGFALVEDVSTGLLSGEISGLMGLGWQPLAASRVTPFWQNLYAASALPFPGFGVSLTRFINVPNASAIEPGGSITFGYLNASLYSSEINYVPIPTGAESYWVIRMDQIAVNGTNTTAWATGQGEYVAIDTGTTLIGGPRDVVASVYEGVEGAQAATGAYTGYYSYFCDTNVSVALTFGGITYNMSSADFNLGPFGVDSATNRSTCLGAFFDLSFGSGSRIQWVVGAAFLKNVYSVFRASPPSVGFALPPNSSSLHYPSFPSNSSDPARDFNLTEQGVPGGIYGPSGGVSVRTTLVAANTVTTAVMAGETVGRVPAGAAARFGGAAGGAAATLFALLVGGALVWWP
ncbi:hypothetical protein JCM8097_002032 [Rhodosporidiobolus ruineniae]